MRPDILLTVADELRAFASRGTARGLPDRQRRAGRERTVPVNAWLTGDALDPVDAVLMRILLPILADNETAPMLKAVVQSHGYSRIALAAAPRRAGS